MVEFTAQQMYMALIFGLACFLIGVQVGMALDWMLKKLGGSQEDK